MDSADSISAPTAPVGPPGVLLFQGSQMRIEDLRISLSEPPSMRVKLSWDIWPLWLRVAIEHEAAAHRFREVLLRADGDENDSVRSKALEDETRACMVAITAAAFTFEAMALSAAARAGLVPNIGSAKGAASRVAEILKQCFAIPADQFMNWRASLRLLFEARDAAVHSDVRFHDPLPHPALRAGVPRPAHVYRLENAHAAVEGAVSTAKACGGAPRPGRGTKFRESVAQWQTIAEELGDLRSELLSQSEGAEPQPIGTPRAPDSH